MSKSNGANVLVGVLYRVNNSTATVFSSPQKRHATFSAHVHAPHAKAQNATMDPAVFGKWLKEQQALIDAKKANNDEIEVPLHYLFWSDGKADKVPSATAKMTKQDPTEYLDALSKKYCMF